MPFSCVAGGYDRELEKAEAEFKRAIELNPSYPSAHQWYAQALECENRKDEAWVEIRKALELSPLSLIINTNVADAYFWSGEYDRGAEQARKVIDMDPNFPSSYQALIFNLLRMSKFGEARKILEPLSKVTDSVDQKMMGAYIDAYEGKGEEARRKLKELSDSEFRGKVSPYFLAGTYARLGDKEKTFEMLEKAYESHDRYILFMGIDYDMEAIRQDPRYSVMLGRIGLAKRLRP